MSLLHASVHEALAAFFDGLQSRDASYVDACCASVHRMSRFANVVGVKNSFCLIFAASNSSKQHETGSVFDTVAHGKRVRAVTSLHLGA